MTFSIIKRGAASGAFLNALELRRLRGYLDATILLFLLLELFESAFHGVAEILLVEDLRRDVAISARDFLEFAIYIIFRDIRRDRYLEAMHAIPHFQRHSDSPLEATG